MSWSRISLVHHVPSEVSSGFLLLKEFDVSPLFEVIIHFPILKLLLNALFSGPVTHNSLMAGEHFLCVLWPYFS
jgi:hypothetical protein